MFYRAAFTLLLLAFALCAASHQGQDPPAGLGGQDRPATKQILVGPNVLVSRESNYPNVELMLAVNPNNPQNLVGTAIVTTSVGDHCTIYVSMDGGSTWRFVDFPILPEDGTGDPQVAFGVDGTAYFTALGQRADQQGKKHMVLDLFRSSDGGLTWEHTGTYGSGHGDDHPQMVADPRPGHAGAIYTTCGCLFGKEESTIGLFRTYDHGSHTEEPIKVVSAPPGMMVFGLNPVVLSDGFLFVPFQVFEPKRLEEQVSPTRDIYFAASSDAGATFSSPSKIRTQVLDPKAHVPSPYGGVFFAADTRSTKFRDRIYMVVDEAVSGRYLLRLSYSKDRGETWSVPKEVASLPSGEASEYQPAICVNRDGVVGISWFGTRDSTDHYSEYFAASLDGGDSFLPAVIVSAEPSSIDAPGNDIARHTIDSPRTNSTGDVEFSFGVTSKGFPIGGEYMGLVADDTGTFHPFWSDARSGNSQVWTTVIKVASLAEKLPENGGAAKSSTPVPLARKLMPVFDPAKYDRRTGIEEIPVRLKNISSDLVCKPLVVELKGKDDASHGPQLLNADNGKLWDGAKIDYSDALGDFSCLEPGSITGALVWKIKVADVKDPFISFQIGINGVKIQWNSRTELSGDH